MRRSREREGEMVMTDRYQPRPDDAAAPRATELAPSKSRSGSSAAEPAIRQLDSIIENLASYATPVVREIAARAAELAAKAGEAAGPIAHRAANKTEAVGGPIADRSREFATDLRRDPSSVDPRAANATPVDAD